MRKGGRADKLVTRKSFDYIFVLCCHANHTHLQTVELNLNVRSGTKFSLMNRVN